MDLSTKSRTRFLLLLVCTGGFVSLGAELAASRLLAPFFGTSLVVWSSLIGLILIALSLGYLLGGRLADRGPRLEVLLLLTAAAGAGISAVPVISRPVLSLALAGFARFEAGMLLGSFLGVLALLGLPMVLLGCITPFAIRLATRELQESGRVAGRLFAISTMGSFLGVFMPTLLLVPVLGTRWTFTTFGLSLLAVTLLGNILVRTWVRAAVTGGLILLALVGGWWASDSPVRPGEGLLAEVESIYQYIRVIEDDKGWRLLRLNEGLVVHSKYHPEHPITNGEWDFMAILPYFAEARDKPVSEARRWAILGAGAGTTARLVSQLYPGSEIVGVEPDPEVVRLGLEFFGGPIPGYRVDVLDGRAWLALNQDRFDLISVDAYRQPYIPFEMTTLEFFLEVRKHLSDDGVMAINVSRPPGDTRLVNALATTISQVFPSVYLINLPNTSLATVVVATCRETDEGNFQRHAARARGPEARLLRLTRRFLSRDFEHTIILTDDLAPVERLMDLMLARQVIGSGAQDLKIPESKRKYL